VPRRLAAYEDALRARVACYPDATIAELQGWLLAERGVSASYSSVWDALNHLNLTYKNRFARRSKIDRMSPRLALSDASSSPA
jgi:transposase